MTALFLKILNMSISAGWFVLAVIMARFLLKKAPKWISVLLWGMVALRLLFPFSIESIFSLIPSRETISPNILMDVTPTLQTGITSLDDIINPGVTQSFAPSPLASANPLQIWIPVLSVVWVVGITALAAYTAISYLRLRKQVATAVRLRENLYQSERVISPFVLGLIRPKIYLPFQLDEQTLEHVVAHEQAHIRRRDHWWKPLGFFLLMVHWFHPLLWLAYILLCRDIELACDEKVIRELGHDARADYSQALLSCSVNRRKIAACPLAFGELGVKARVKTVLHYRKPTCWIVAAALLLCIIVAVCFLTDPPGSSGEPDLSLLNYKNAVSLAAEQEELTAIYCPPSNGNEEASIQIGAASGAELAKYLDQWDWRECRAPRESLSSSGSVEFVISAYHRITVYQRKPGTLRQYAVVTFQNGTRYYAISRHDYADAVALVYATEKPVMNDGSAVQKWFDYLEAPEEMMWDGRLELSLPEFPDVTFCWYPEKMEAITESEIIPLYHGMPIWNTYFCDLTGDGFPELCSTYSLGSGIIDSRIIIYDYQNGAGYELADRGNKDFTLSAENDQLIVTIRQYNSDEVIDRGVLSYLDGALQILWEDRDATQWNVSQKAPLSQFFEEAAAYFESVQVSVRHTAYVRVDDRIAIYEKLYDETPDTAAESILKKYVGTLYREDAEFALGMETALTYRNWYLPSDSQNLQYLIQDHGDGAYSLWKFCSFSVQTAGEEPLWNQLYPDNRLFRDADLTPYTYGEVYRTIYGLEDAKDLASLIARPSTANNTTSGQEIQEQVGTYSYQDASDLQTFYESTVDLLCYGENHWDMYYEIPYRFTYQFSTDAEDKLSSGEETWGTRYLSVILTDGTVIDSLKYNAIRGCIYEFSGICSDPLPEDIVYRLNEIFGIQ